MLLLLQKAKSYVRRSVRGKLHQVRGYVGRSKHDEFTKRVAKRIAKLEFKHSPLDKNCGFIGYIGVDGKLYGMDYSKEILIGYHKILANDLGYDDIQDVLQDGWVRVYHVPSRDVGIGLAVPNFPESIQLAIDYIKSYWTIGDITLDVLSCVGSRIKKKNVLSVRFTSKNADKEAIRELVRVMKRA